MILVYLIIYSFCITVQLQELTFFGLYLMYCYYHLKEVLVQQPAGSLTKVTLDELSSSVDDDELIILFLCLKFLLSLSCSASVVKSV